MLALMLLSVLVGPPSSRPDVEVNFTDASRLHVTVLPPVGRTVKAIALAPPADRTKRAERHTPHTRVTLPPDSGVRYTFTPIPEPFVVIVTLDDNSTYRLGKNAWGKARRTGPLRPPRPRSVEPIKLMPRGPCPPNAWSVECGT